MGAYFQNQVVTKDTNGQEHTLCYIGSGLKFMESQYALNKTMLTTVAQLKNNSSKSNTAKVYTVCDYDCGDYDESTLKYFNGKPREWVSDSSANIKFFDEYEEDTKLPVCGDGVIVNKSKREYINIAQITELARKMRGLQKGMLISPLAMLTRHSLARMGGGDLRYEEAQEPKIGAILARWYDDELYWCEDTEDNLFGLMDITDKTLWAEVNTCAVQIHPDTGNPS